MLHRKFRLRRMIRRVAMLVGPLLFFWFLATKRNSYIYSFHQPHAILPSDSDASMFRPLGEGFDCTGKEQGPFIRLSRPINGIGNQVHYLHDALTLLHGFQGTIIFPRTSSCRIPMTGNDSRHDWKEVLIESLFDVTTIVRNLRTNRMSVCVDSAMVCRKPLHFLSDALPFNLWFLARRCLGRVGCTSAYFNQIVKRHYDNNICLVLPNVWGAVPIPHTARKITGTAEVSVAARLSISFAPHLEDMGARVFQELLLSAKQKSHKYVSVVHLRVERDYRQHMRNAYGFDTSSPAALLKPYQEFFAKHKLRGFYYVAVGGLSDEEYRLTSKWANDTFGNCWTEKKRLYIYKELALYEPDQHAIVDYYVMLKARNFVGTGVSSLSYIASEMRDFLGFRSWLVLPPADIYYPMLGPHYRTWSESPQIRSF